MTNENGQTLRCPKGRQASVKNSEDDILGCGSTHIGGPDREGFYDCGDCGIWFRDPEVTEENER